MANNNETTTKFKVDISELKKAMQEARKQVAYANSEFKAVSSSLDDWSKSSDGLNAKLKQLKSNLDSQETVLNEYKKTLEEIKVQYGENSAEAREYETKLNNQQAVVNRIQKEITNYEETLGKVSQAEKIAAKSGKDVSEVLDEMEDKADEAGDGFTVLKATIADLASKAISSAVDALKDFVAQANEVEKAVNGLQSSTGASASEMKKYEKVMKDIYKNNYGESYEDIANSMSQVVQVMGELDNKDLNKITTNGLALRDTFGFEMPESLRAINSLMDQFGVTADEAYNLVAQGAQNGLNQNDDLLDVINEYSVQFKNSGYSADQMFNMLKNGADAGVWSVDKLGDAVKEMNIRFSDGTVVDALNENAKALGLSKKEVAALQAEYNKGGDSAQKAVGKMIDSILNVKDETKQYQLGVSVFGTMWEDLGVDAIKALMSTKGEITSTKNAMDDIKNTKYDDVGSSLQTLGRMFKEEILTPIQEHIMPKLKEFVDYMVENFPAIKDAFVDGLNTLKEWIPTLTILGSAIAAYFVATKIIAFIEAIKNGTLALKLMTAAQTALNAVMSLNPIGLVIAAIVALVAAFVILWNKSEKFREFWTGLWNGIVASVKLVWQVVTEVFGKAVDWFKTKVTDPLSIRFKAMWEAIKILATATWTAIKTVFTVASTWFNNTVVSPVKNAFTNAWNAVKTGASNAWNGIKSVFSTVGTFFKDTFTKAWTAVKNVFSTGGKIFDGIKEGIVSMFKTIVNAIIRGINRVVSVPFNAINNVLDKIKGTSVAGIKPFKGLPSISIPSIPELAKGGILKRGQVGLLEGDGAEAVVPLEKNTQWIRGIAKQLARELGVSSSSVTGAAVGVGGVVNNYNQTINSPKALTRLEIYRQSKNLLSFSGGAF